VWRGAADLRLLRREELDVCDRAAVADAMDGFRPDTVLHAAGFTDVDGAERRPKEAESVNHLAARDLARECAAQGVFLIALGTDYVFDGALTRPYLEEDAPAPLSVYGRTKLRGERAVREANGPHLIARTQAIYGHGRKHLVSKLLEQGDPESEFRVVDDRTSQPTFADHLARGLLALWRRGVRGTCHVANTGPVSWYGFALLVRQATGFPRGRLKPIRSAERGEIAPRPPYSALDTSRFTEATGERMPSVRDGLKAYLDSLAVTGG
jgi:dTDP-4-dehydrorhamnose reductase